MDRSELAQLPKGPHNNSGGGEGEGGADKCSICLCEIEVHTSGPPVAWV